MILVRAYPSSIFKDSISAFSGVKFEIFGLFLDLLGWFVVGGEGWKLLASGFKDIVGWVCEDEIVEDDDGRA